MPEQIPLTPRQISKRAYYEANRSRLIEKSRTFYESNRDAELMKGRARCEANPEKALNKRAKRRAKRRANTVGTLTPGIIPKLLESQKWTCVVCSKDLRLGYHVDHIVPVSKGGQNVDDNVQLLCPKCNLSKGNNDFAEFLKGRGLDPSNYQGISNPSENL